MNHAAEPLSPQLLARVLREYGDVFRGAMPDASAITPGFSGAAVVMVTTPSDRFCLRGWPADADAKRIAGIHQLLAFILRGGLSCVPVPMSTASGASLVRVDNRLWQIEPWMPGTADFHSRPSHERLRNILRTLANWHHLAADFVRATAQSGPGIGSRAVGLARPLTTSERIESIDWYTHRLPLLQQKLREEQHPEFASLAARALAALQRQAPMVRGELVRLSDRVVPVQPCIRDVWHDHILLTGDDVTGVIDYGTVRMDSVAADLSRLISSLVGNDPVAWNIAIDAYSSRRPLSLDEQALIGPYDRSGALLSAMTWLKRRWRLDAPDTAGMAALFDVERVVLRLRGILDRLEL